MHDPGSDLRSPDLADKRQKNHATDIGDHGNRHGRKQNNPLADAPAPQPMGEQAAQGRQGNQRTQPAADIVDNHIRMLHRNNTPLAHGQQADRI